MPMPFGLVEDPIDDKERLQVASTCVEDLKLPMPALIDGVDDKVGRTYGGWPDRLYLIGKDGKIAFAGTQGPAGFDPEAWEKAIVAEKVRLAEAAKAAAEKKAPDEKPSEKPVGPKR